MKGNHLSREVLCQKKKGEFELEGRRKNPRKEGLRRGAFPVRGGKKSDHTRTRGDVPRGESVKPRRTRE